MNEAKISNLVKREFNNRIQMEVIVSDLTYVRVNEKWNCVCLILDLHNREIIGYNAVAEATFKTFKIEFVYPNYFESLNQLKIELFDYVNWYNNIRLYSSLEYISPITYKNINFKKMSKLVLIFHNTAKRITLEKR